MPRGAGRSRPSHLETRMLSAPPVQTFWFPFTSQPARMGPPCALPSAP